VNSIAVSFQPRARFSAASERSKAISSSSRSDGSKIRGLNKRRGRFTSSSLTSRRCRRRRRRRRQGAALYWGLRETQNRRPRPSSLERGHGGIIASRLLYIVEIGLLKNYAESRGPIPRGGSVETLLLSFRSVPRRLLAPSIALASKTSPSSPLCPHIPAAGSLIQLKGHR